MELILRKILVIDDNEDNLLTLKALIFDLPNNYQVYTATSGQQGIEIAKQIQPDLILLDILMPTMDGFSTCKNIKEDSSLHEIPIVFVTALKETKENKIRALDVGADGFLSKPVDECELSANINAFLKVKESNDFKKSEKQRLEILIAEHTMLLREELLQNKEMSDRLRESNKRLAAFLQSSRQITSMISHEELMQVIVDNAISAIDVTSCALYMLKDEVSMTLVSAVPPLPLDLPENIRTVKLEDFPYLKNTLSTNNHIIIEDTQEIPLTQAEQNVVNSHGLRSILNVPICLKESVIGVLILGSVKNKHVFTNEDIFLLQGFCHQVAQVYENVKNYDQIKIYAKELEIEIAERIQAEKNFKYSIDDSPLGIRIVTQNGSTVYANQALLDIYEIESLDEYINSEARKFYTNKSYNEHIERKKIREKGGEVSNYEISIFRKDGEIRHIKVWRKEVIWNKEKHYQVINQDITEQKKLYDDLVAAKEKAEESDRLKSAFLANMSHEIRTPMNGILGFMELLTDPDLTEKEKREYYDIMKRSGERLLNTINDIIEISKIEAHLVNIQKSPFCMASLMKEITDFFSPEAAKKGLKLNLNLSLTPTPQAQTPTAQAQTFLVYTDLAKIESIVTNLVKNAIKFTHTGEINITISRKQSPEPTICLIVSDTGEGIPKDKLEQIFDRFTQAERTLNRVYEGSGLGLSITKEYVKLLNGTITVDSQVNIGSTFTVEFPESELQ